MKLLDEYEQIVLAQLGAISAHKILQSKDSSKCIRDLAKQLSNVSTALRKELVLFDKTLVLKQTETESV